MASIADLNVRLGLIYRNFDKGLEQVERKLRSSGRQLAQLGDQLTVAVSLPLAAAGAAAVKSAADIESLQLALESQLGSTEAARKELELLRQEALKPGLGFEQAVRASVSLQAVGFAAAQARKVTTEFGNALALAGKGAAELDGVVLALTQISAKGVVSAEEINQIAERLPQIRTLMQQAFGTASSEAIQKLGINSTQFIQGITAELEKLPRAAGGIRNSLDNFFDGIKQGAAKFGFAISKALDVPGKLESLTAGLGAMADGFANLNPEVQQFIVYAGAAVIAAGPLAKVFGAISLAGAQFIGLLQGAGGVLKGVTGTVLGLADSVNRLKLAFGIIGVVAAVAGAVYLLSQRFDAAAYSQEQFAQATRAVTDETAKEIGALDRNFEVLKNLNSTTGERKTAIDALLAQYPSYLKGINLEVQSVDQLTGIHKKLVEQIQRGVAERKKAEAINAIYEKRAAIILRIQQLQEGAQQTAGEATLVDTGDVLRAGSIAGAVIEKLKQQSEDLRVSADATGRQFDAAFGLVGAAARRASPASQVLGEIKPVADKAAESAGKLAGGMKGVAKSTGEAKTELDAYLDKLHEQETLQNKIREAAASMGLAPLAPLPQAQPGVASTAPAAESPVQTVGTGIVQTLTPAQALIQSLAADAQNLNDIWTLLAENVATNGGVMQQALLGMTTAAEQFAASGGSSLGEFSAALAGAAKKAIGDYIRIGVAAVVSAALARGGLLGPFAAIALGKIAGSAAQTLFNSMLSKIKIPGFAQGTKFAPGGLAMVGEKGPELVSLPRGSQVTPNNQLQNDLMNRSVNVNGEFRIKGTDLVVVLEKTMSQNNRIRGF